MNKADFDRLKEILLTTFFDLGKEVSTMIAKLEQIGILDEPFAK